MSSSAQDGRNTVSVPDDIWRCIALFLSRDDLCRMVGVNSALFHLAMDARYQSVTFEDFGPAKVEKWERLRDPSISPRLRHVHLCAVLRAPKYMNVSSSNGERDVTSEPHSDGKAGKTVFDASLSSEELFQIMIDTISIFSNVTDFSLNWPFDGISEELLFPLLTTVWNTLGTKLSKVGLDADMKHWPALLSTIGKLPALQELELDIHGISPTCPGGLHNFWTTAVVPFINKAAPFLRSFSLALGSKYWVPSRLDHSILFNSLDKMPHLEKLAIDVEFEACGLHDPRGLTRILREHVATLRHVKWASAQEGMKNEFVNWMQENNSDRSILSNLCTLETFVPSGPVGFNLVVGYIGRSADTLMSLSLFGLRLSDGQVNAVLSIFAHRRAEQRLETLHLHIEFLSLELVLVIARMLPYLYKLTVNTEDVSEALESWRGSRDGVKELRNTQEFPAELGNRSIRSWPLRDIEIFRQVGWQRVPGLMRIFADSLPSIRWNLSGTIVV